MSVDLTWCLDVWTTNVQTNALAYTLINSSLICSTPKNTCSYMLAGPYLCAGELHFGQSARYGRTHKLPYVPPWPVHLLEFNHSPASRVDSAFACLWVHVCVLLSGVNAAWQLARNEWGPNGQRLLSTPMLPASQSEDATAVVARSLFVTLR